MVDRASIPWFTGYNKSCHFLYTGLLPWDFPENCSDWFYSDHPKSHAMHLNHRIKGIKPCETLQSQLIKGETSNHTTIPTILLLKKLGYWGGTHPAFRSAQSSPKLPGLRRLLMDTQVGDVDFSHLHCKESRMETSPQDNLLDITSNWRNTD